MPAVAEHSKKENDLNDDDNNDLNNHDLNDNENHDFNDDDNHDLNDDDNDLLDKAKKHGHLGGIRQKVQQVIGNATAPLKTKLEVIEGKLEKLSQVESLSDQVKPLAAKIDEYAENAESYEKKLQKAVAVAEAGAETLLDLKKDIATRASSTELEKLTNAAGNAAGKVKGNMEATHKTVVKNQKYLKAIYKSIHH